MGFFVCLFNGTSVFFSIQEEWCSPFLTSYLIFHFYLLHSVFGLIFYLFQITRTWTEAGIINFLVDFTAVLSTVRHAFLSVSEAFIWIHFQQTPLRYNVMNIPVLLRRNWDTWKLRLQFHKRLRWYAGFGFFFISRHLLGLFMSPFSLLRRKLFFSLLPR